MGKQGAGREQVTGLAAGARLACAALSSGGSGQASTVPPRVLATPLGRCQRCSCEFRCHGAFIQNSCGVRNVLKCSFCLTRSNMYRNVRFMKKKWSKKRSNIPTRVNARKAIQVPTSASPAAAGSFQQTLTMPPPEVLFQQAEQEPDFRALSAYVDSIRMLRDKGFSYRDIAEWLSE